MRSRTTMALAAVMAATALLAGCASEVGGVAVVNTSLPLPTSLSTTSGDENPPTSEPVPPTTDTPAPPTTETIAPPTTETIAPPTTTQTPPLTSTDPPTTSQGTEPEDPDFPTAPITLPEFPQSAAAGALAESRRLADTLVAVPLFLPEYKEAAASATAVLFDSPAAIRQLLPDPAPLVAAQTGMTTGFASIRVNHDNNVLAVAVFEYPDAAAAASGAQRLAESVQGLGPEESAAVVSQYDDAVGWSGRYADGEQYFHVFLADRELVYYVYLSNAPRGTTKLDALARKVFDQQLAAFEGFEPTPASEFTSLPLDPKGLLARTVPEARGRETVYYGTYTLNGFLHFSTDPADDFQLGLDAGMDLMAIGRTTVYRTLDEDGAKIITDGYQGQIRRMYPDMVLWNGLDGVVPNAECLADSSQGRYYCTFSTGRYAIEYWGTSEEDMRKSLVSQNQMLQGG